MTNEKVKKKKHSQTINSKKAINTANQKKKHKKRKLDSSNGETSTTSSAQFSNSSKKGKGRKNNNIRKPPKSLASKLKSLRGTAETTPFPPEWKANRTKGHKSLSPKDGDDFYSCLNTSYKGKMVILAHGEHSFYSTFTVN